MRASSGVAAIGMAVCLLCAAACKGTGVTGTKLDASLTPARNLVGTWKTTFPVRVYYQTDFCNGTKETVGQADWMVTYVITSTSNENVVNVSMSATATNYTKTNSSCGSGSTGYVPNVWPTTLTGNVSSTNLIATKTSWGMKYDGSFTTDLMMGTWTHWECIIYCTGEYTDTNQLKLIRQ